MSMSYAPCPKCGTLLLSETAQCHRCKHVLRPEHAETFRDSVLPSDAAVQQDLESCKQCGETIRKGLVRCWSCGAFTRPEIEAAYYRLLRGHARSMATAGQRTELRELTEEEARQAYADDESLQRYDGSRSEISAVDDDFDFSGELQFHEGQTAASQGLSVDEDDMFDSIPVFSTGLADVSESLTPPAGLPTFGSLNVEPIPLAAAPVPVAPVSPAAEAPPAPPAPSASPAGDNVDDLLSIAKEQERDARKQRRARHGDGFVVYCPMGCKIRVQERHRGMMGRCPKCGASFMVPVAPQAPAGQTAAPTPAGETPTVAATTGPQIRWMTDVCLHRVAPEKLRIKADSLLKEFIEVDLGFTSDRLLLVGLAPAGGMFGGKNPKKKETTRAAVIEHLKTKDSMEGLPGSFKHEIFPGSLSQLTMIQPSPAGVESLFGSVLVFGTGRIAVRLPKFDEKTTAYLSFSLSQFREFSKLLAEVYGVENFGGDCLIPLEDKYETFPCYLSQTPIRELQRLEYYQKDASFQLEAQGYRCKTCSATICEAARKSQKLGGVNGKGIAKAKCPKCKKPMGNQTMYSLADVPSPPSAAAPPEAASPSELETAAV